MIIKAYHKIVKLEQFAANVYWALYNDPSPLSNDQRYLLSWEAATERLIDASMISKGNKLQSQEIGDKFLAWALEKVSQFIYFLTEICSICFVDFF